MNASTCEYVIACDLLTGRSRPAESEIRHRLSVAFVRVGNRLVSSWMGWRMRQGLIGRTIIPMPRWNWLRIQAAIVAARMRTRLRGAGTWRMRSDAPCVALWAATDKDDAVLCRFVRACFNSSGGSELACLCQRQSAQRERECQRHDQPMRPAKMLSRNKSMRVHAVSCLCNAPCRLTCRRRCERSLAIAVSRREKSGRL